MKILIVSTMTGVPWGGSEELWAELAWVAHGEGHEVTLVTHPPSSEPEPIKRFRAAGMTVYHRRAAIERRLSRNHERWVGLFPALLRWRPDLICVSQGSAFNIGYDPELARFVTRARVPYLVVCQHAFDYRMARDDHRSVAARFLRDASTVAFVAEKNRRSVERQIACDLPNSVVVRNPVNLAETAIVPWPTASSIRLACVARLVVETKGQDVLFEILGREEWRARDWQLQLYGVGPDQPWLARLARYHGIDHRIEFRGHVADIRKLWAENDLALFPSRSEGTPLALVEAMLCGRPAVVTDVGGNAEWVDEGRTGFVAEAATGRSFGSALERAWLARANWQEMGRDAHQFASLHADSQAGRTLFGLLSRTVPPRRSASLSVAAGGLIS